jgi:hypothetical protein
MKRSVNFRLLTAEFNVPVTEVPDLTITGKASHISKGQAVLAVYVGELWRSCLYLSRQESSHGQYRSKPIRCRFSKTAFSIGFHPTLPFASKQTGQA